MSSNLRQPSRIAAYTAEGSYYPRELVEVNGELYLINTDGSKTRVNPSGITTLIDSSGTEIASIDPTAEDTIELPEASTTQSGLVKFSTTAPKANGATASVGKDATAARSDHVHPLQTTISGNAFSATKLKSGNTIALSGGATGTATNFDGSTPINIPVTALDAAKLTGIIPLACMPHGALERLVVTSTDTTRLALTLSDVQNGDVIKVEDTGLMYYVADETKLGTEAAFEKFTAGTASAVAWANVTNKPDFASVATSGKYSDLSETPTIPVATNTVALASGDASAGTSEDFARADHIHPVQTNVSGNAGTATKLETPRTIDGVSFDGSSPVLHYGVCNTTGSTVNKEVTIDNFELVEGAFIIVKFVYGNTASNPTLNVNGTGALPMFKYGSTRMSGDTYNGWAANSIQMLIYDGNGWVRNYWNLKLLRDYGFAYCTCSTAASTTAKTCSSTGYKYTDGGIVTVKFTYSVPENATLNISSNGAKSIYYGSTKIKANVIKGGDTATFISFNSTYRLISIDRWQDDITDILTSLEGKQETITGAATSIASSDLGPSKTLISDESGKVAISSVTSTELGYLSGVTSSIQTQLNDKASSSHGTHVTFSDTVPYAASDSASAGSAETVSRSDHVHPLQTTISGNAATATKLNSGNTISLSEGVTSTATNFDGSTAISIPVTEIKESYLSWGGKTIADGVSPLDAAMYNPLSANRLAYIDNNDITIEYTNDGSTWVDYGASDIEKCELTTLEDGANLYIGSKTTDITADDKLRITIKARVLYFALRKMLIYITTNGAGNCKVLIEESKCGSETVFTEVGTYDISGWSGWNSIPSDVLSNNRFGGSDTQTNNIRCIRFTFSATPSEYYSDRNNLAIHKIRMFGETCWDANNDIAKNGHLYNYDYNKNVTFPAGLAANSFTENGTKLSDKYAPISHGTHVTFSDVAPAPNATTASAGSAETVSRSDHVHPLQTTISGNAATATTATKVENSMIVKLNGGTIEDADLFTFNGSAAKTIDITPSSIGAATTDIATASSNGLFSSADKKYLDSTKSISLGSAKNLTIPDLKEILYNWLTSTTVDTIFGSKARIAMSSTFIDLWNSGDTTTIIGDGGAYCFEILSFFWDQSAGFIRITHPSSTNIYYVRVSSGGVWSDIYANALTTSTVEKAKKLSTTKYFKISGGANSPSVGFDGSDGVTFNVDELKESYIRWGGKNISGSVSALDAALYPEFSANRLAFMDTNDIFIEYSNDGGSTWIDYEAQEYQKSVLTNTADNANLYIGKKDGNGDAVTTDDKLRITFTATKGKLYFVARKAYINLSTNGASGSSVLIERSKIGSEDVFETFDTSNVSGWPGWNSINLGFTFGGTDSQTNQYRKIRLTFSIGGVSTGNKSNLRVCRIGMVGETCWDGGSSLALNGHLYSYRYNGDATFPAELGATSLAENGIKISDKYAPISHGTHVTFSDVAPAPNATTASAGSAETVSRSDHVHPLQTTISGNAATATKVNENIVVKLNDGSTEDTDLFTFNGSAAKTINITPAAIGAATASHGTHVTFSDTVPNAAGTADVGSASTVSRSDHVHPKQTISRTYTAFIGTTWSGSAAPYTQTISVSGMTASDNPIVDVVLSGTYATDETALVEYAKIYRITTSENSITVYASEKTESAVNIQLKCVNS